MPSYRTQRFWTALELDEDEEVAGVRLSPKPNAENIALVKQAPDDQRYQCGVETDSGECAREVGGPDQVCWQHEE